MSSEEAQRVALDISIAFDEHWHVYEKQGDFLFKEGGVMLASVVSPSLRVSNGDLIAYELCKNDIFFKRCALNWTSETGKLQILYEGSIVFMRGGLEDVVKQRLPAGVVYEVQEW